MASDFLHFLLWFFLCMEFIACYSPSPLPASFPFLAPPIADQAPPPLEYLDPTLPPLVIDQNPKCSLVILRHDFADTVGAPPVSVGYTPPPGCPPPWSHVVLELSASASGIQKDRVTALWLDGAEILRTTTPMPMAPGVHWRVRKDATRYTALLRGATGIKNTPAFSMMLENSNATFPGVYSVNVSLHFYRGRVDSVAIAGESHKLDEAPGIELSAERPKLSAHPTIKGLYREPADLIVPISNKLGGCGSGYWFKVHNESDVKLANVVVPRNTYRAVLEVYVSHHGDDECWYANPLRSVVGSKSGGKANGGFRQVVLTVDKRFAGSVIPFPVISPGSVNPFFWAPVAAIGAYNHPSYDLDLTPFTGLLLDGKEHQFGLTVKDSQPYWLVSGNLHLWLDAWSDGVEAALVRNKVPPLRLNRQADWREQDGKSTIDGQVIVRFSGWVSSSKGNVTTSLKHRIKFKNRVEVHGRGAIKQVEMEVKERINVRTQKSRGGVVGRVQVDRAAPLRLEVARSNGGGGSVFEKTKLYHELVETTAVAVGKEAAYSVVADRQDSEGSALMEEGGAARWGSGDTKSIYKYRDDKACYLRTVNMIGGRVKDDVESASCSAAARS